MRGRLLGDFPMLHLSTFPPKTWAVLVTALFFLGDSVVSREKVPRLRLGVLLPGFGTAKSALEAARWADLRFCSQPRHSAWLEPFARGCALLAQNLEKEDKRKAGAGPPQARLSHYQH